MHFLDLGTLRVEVGGDLVSPGGRRSAALLSTLLVHLNYRVSVDLLIDAVWGDQASDRAGDTLVTHVWRLRRIIEPQREARAAASVLVHEGGGYRLTVPVDQVSSARFERLSREVTDLLTSDQPGRALAAAEEALGLWRGAPFVDIADRIWAAGAIARLDELHLQVQERRIDAILATGDHHRAILEGQTLVREHPLRERLWAQRMVACYRAGRTDEALLTFRELRRLLVRETGVEPGTELAALHQQILDRDPVLDLRTSALDVSPRPVEVHLPRARQLIGRQYDRDAVERMIDQRPLVTIVGSAGCGKTSLAIEAARSLAPRFADGVWFVDLSAATVETDIAAEVVAALGLVVPPSGSLASVLASYARERQALLVLDNCEQILGPVGEVCAQLTAAGRELRVVATSREALDLEDERIFGLEPLSFSGDSSTDPIISSSAAQLFFARDQLRRGPGDLDREDRDALARICEAVDGLPLALELAASWTASYSLAEIADQVDLDPGGLASVGNNHTIHHRTLHAAIDRSYQLLRPEEQALHRALSVLPGGFSRALAEGLGGDELDPREIGGLLARLVHRSLLTVTRSGSTTRFAQLSTVRSHAARSLAQSGQASVMKDRRDEWIVALIRRRPIFGRAEVPAWLEEVTADLPAVRSTLHRHLIETPDELGAEAASVLVDYWYCRGLTEEGLKWLALAVEPGSNRTALAPLTLLSFSTMLMFAGRSMEAHRSLAHAVSGLPRSRIPPPKLAEYALATAGAFSLDRDSRSMRVLLDLVQPLLAQLDTPHLSVAWDSITCLADTFEEPSTQTRDRAQACYERAAATGNLWAAWLACSSLTLAAIATRDPEFGLPWACRVIVIQEQLGVLSMHQQFESVAVLLVLKGALEPAVQVLSASYAAARRVGVNWPRSLHTPDQLARAQQELPKPVFDRAWAVGRTLSRGALLELGRAM